MLLEHDGAHVGQIDDGVDDGKTGLGEFLGHLFQSRCLGKADPDHRVRPTLRHAPQGLLALGFVGDLEFAILDAGFLLEALNAVEHTLVEGFVEFAAHVEDDGRIDLRRARQGR